MCGSEKHVSNPKIQNQLKGDGMNQDVLEVFMEKKKKVVLKEYYRRNIKMPGLSLSFVVTPEGKLLRPVEEIRSRTGAHGDDVYVVDPPVYVLRYERSNSGKVRWSIWLVEGQDKERRVLMEEVPLPVLKAFLVAVESEGLELNPWEEDEVWEEDEIEGDTDGVA